MNDAPPELNRSIWRRNLTFLAFCVVASSAVVGSLWTVKPLPGPSSFDKSKYEDLEFQEIVSTVNFDFDRHWATNKINTVQPADTLLLARRLSLGLTGTLPSLEEIRALEEQDESVRVQWWLSRLFEDRRYSDYLAERLARAYVGVENGPFLVYRRRRMVDWISDQIQGNRPYDELARELIHSKGTWTTQPQANFITATIEKGEKGGPSEIKLATRLTRAFLGVRIDCVQCHDDMFGDRWKQQDFHQLAAFFGEADVGFSGVRDNEKLEYEYRYRRSSTEEVVPPVVPFSEELLPAEGELRERLAAWATHRLNRPFSRTIVNRIWALMFNRPLVPKIDSIPLEGPYPPAMEALVDDLIAHDFDLQRLIRVIAATQVFQLDSKSEDSAYPITKEHEEAWASYPLSRLRPEQVAGGIIQASRLRTINAEAHIIQKIQRFIEQNDFVKRYGDFGADEFGEQAGTIPQRLLMMNGKLVRDRTKNNIFLNAAARIAALSPSDKKAVETAYLCVLTRRPTAEEFKVFVSDLAGLEGAERQIAVGDICWALLNSTEFAWNH
jgi:hypothetical protein